MFALGDEEKENESPSQWFGHVRSVSEEQEQDISIVIVAGRAEFTDEDRKLIEKLGNRGAEDDGGHDESDDVGDAPRPNGVSEGRLETKEAEKMILQWKNCRFQVSLRLNEIRRALVAFSGVKMGRVSTEAERGCF